MYIYVNPVLSLNVVFQVQSIAPQEKVAPPPAPVQPPETAADQSPAAFWSRLKSSKPVPTSSPSPPKDSPATSPEQLKQNAALTVATGQQPSPVEGLNSSQESSVTPAVVKTPEEVNKAVAENDRKSHLVENVVATETVVEEAVKTAESVPENVQNETNAKGGGKVPKTNVAAFSSNAVANPLMTSRSEIEDLSKRKISVEVKNKPEELPRIIPMPPKAKVLEHEDKKIDSIRKDENKQEDKEAPKENILQSQVALKQDIETEIPPPTQPPKTLQDLVKTNPPIRVEKLASSKEKLPKKKIEYPQTDLPKLNNSLKNENSDRTEGITPKPIIVTNNGSTKVEKKTVKFQDPPETVEKLHPYDNDKEDAAELCSPVSVQKSSVSEQTLAPHSTVTRQSHPQLMKREPGNVTADFLQIKH